MPVLYLSYALSIETETFGNLNNYLTVHLAALALSSTDLIFDKLLLIKFVYNWKILTKQSRQYMRLIKKKLFVLYPAAFV